MKAAAVNRESQTKLAKLLAKENIRVSVGNYHTAFFDIKKRILGLPTWNVDNKNVSDLLIGHEVGHALYTPSDAIDRFKTELPNVPFDIGNIVEDIRIERMIKNNYPGLVYSFKQGYSYFVQKDFFKIEGQPLDSFGFADRLNIHAKIGEFVDVPLNDTERDIYNRCMAAETYDDVLALCKEIVEYINTLPNDSVQNTNPQTNNNAEESIQQDSSSSAGGKSSTHRCEQSDSDTSTDNNDSATDSSDMSNATDSSTSACGREINDDDNKANQSTSDDSQSRGDSKPQQNGGGTSSQRSGDNDELRSNTMQNLEDNIKSMQEEIDHPIANAPRLQDMMKSVISVDDVMSDRRTSTPTQYSAIMNSPDFAETWHKFKKSTAKNISTLISEFERRKAAYQYSRAKTSDTGAIDVNRLHAYKFEDNIFKSVTSLADAKNHGMLFFIDYSASMQYTIGRVIDQTLQLVYFCKAVGIPFEVYGFTTISTYFTYGASQQLPEQLSDMEAKDTLPGFNPSFENTKVFQLLNSSMDKKKFELACRELKAQTQTQLRNWSSPNSVLPLGGKFETLNGTPLHETVIIAHELVKRFKSKHNTQKTTVVFLTDGDGGPVEFKHDSSAKEYEKNQRHSSKVMIPINGRNVIIDSRDRHMYAKLIENLKVTCGVTTIGFFIAEYRNAFKNNCIAALQYQGKNITTWSAALERFKPQMNAARRDKCFTVIGGFNFDAYFIFDAQNNLSVNNDEEFDLDLDDDADYTSAASQNKIAKAFTKYNTDKKSNRVFLSKFAEIIA